MKRALTLMVVGLIGASLALAPMTYAGEGVQGNSAAIQLAAKKKVTKHRHRKGKASTGKASTGSSTSGESKN